MKILIENEDEQKVIEQIQEWADSGIGISEMARKLNDQGVVPPQGKEWSKSLIYNLRLRMGQISPRSIISAKGVRPKERILSTAEEDQLARKPVPEIDRGMTFQHQKYPLNGSDRGTDRGGTE